MTQVEQEYFKMLGNRVAQLRKAQSLTQVQLAQTLGISQQMVASYEIGRRRIPVSMLTPLARVLHVQIDELLAELQSANPSAAPHCNCDEASSAAAT